MINLSPVVQLLMNIVFIGGGVIGYTAFQNEKMKFENEKFLTQRLDSLPVQTARILMPQLKHEIKDIMVDAGLVDYSLIFRSDSTFAANTYNKIINSNKGLLSEQSRVYIDLLDSLVAEKIELEQIKIKDKIITVKLGDKRMYLEWKYNPGTDSWGLVEIPYK